MTSGDKRALLIALLIAAIGLAACVVKTAPTRHHTHQRVHSNERHEPRKHKHKKHKHKHKKHRHR